MYNNNDDFVFIVSRDFVRSCQTPLLILADCIPAHPYVVAGNSAEVDAPEVLFPTRIYGGGTEAAPGRQYDVAADGRFLINTLVGEGSTAPITLIQNWNPQAVR